MSCLLLVCSHWVYVWERDSVSVAMYKFVGLLSVVCKGHVNSPTTDLNNVVCDGTEHQLQCVNDSLYTSLHTLVRLHI